ncbi:MAG: hypothetical protein JXA77_09655 [Bacteroidales bacterium]|nr:hypothetical protein [Bacteroidales bacterium]MBN2818535.1 hypothetical protein [Bacteroidales bacterium]
MVNRKNLITCLVFISTALWLHVGLFAFSIKNVGYATTKNYLKESYNAATQNWDIDQDDKGIMYFANSAGLLQFDGAYWKLYPLPNRSIVRSVRIDNEGRIWVGGFNQIGYFSPDEKGNLVFNSVIKLLEPQYRDFGDIWKIYTDGERILIQTFTAILEYKDGIIRPLVWNADIHYSFFCNNELYVKENHIGLSKLVNSELILVPDGEIFADYVISSVLPYSVDAKLIVTANHGLFIEENNSIKPFKTPIASFLADNQTFHASYYKGYYFIGTIQNGLVILDSELNLVQHINRYRGLQNNTILATFIDREENLWLGLDNGIDYVKTNSPLTMIANKHEVGAGYQATLFGEKLFLGSNQGLFYTTWSNKANLYSKAGLNSVEGMQGQVWLLKEINGELFCGHDKGTFTIKKQEASQIADIDGASSLHPIPGTNYLIQGTYSGIIILEKKGDSPNFKFRNKVEGFSNSGRNLLIDKSGFIWISHGYKGIYRLKLTPDFRKVFKQKHYGKDQGLPENFGLKIQIIDDQMIVSSENGYFYYNAEKDFFFPYEPLDQTFDNERVNTFINDPYNKNIWFFSDERMGIIKPNFDGSFNIEFIPFAELDGKYLSGYESIYFLNTTNIIISTEDGFVHFDPTYRKKYNTPFKVLIREMAVSPDSVFFGGNYSKDKAFTQNISLSYNDNSLKLKYAAPLFDSPKTLEYSYILEGFEDDWSEWSNNTSKEYTNLPPGDYIFRVKARNNFEFESDEDQYLFTILPPWYQSLTAYILYIISGLLTIALIIYIVIRRFENERKKLQEKQKHVLQEKEQVFEKETMKAEQEIIKLRNEKLELDNQRKQSEIENKTKELASIAMQMTYKNEMLHKVAQKLSKVSQKMIHQESKYQVEGLIKTLEKDMVRDDDWEKFELSFDQVHEDFLKKLRKNFLELSPKDLRLCAYLRMNLSSKEIAPLLNISIRGVEISRYRLRRKLGIDRDKNLTEFMMNL